MKLSLTFIDKESHCFDLTTDQDIEKAESSQSEFIENAIHNLSSVLVISFDISP
jgi:hypothetical protein